MNVTPCELPEVLLIEPTVFRDERGFFLESWHEWRYAQAGLPGPFVQDNHSFSRRGTLRGLHVQASRPQGKLVRVTQGEMFDVAVDVRQGSPSFGRWVARVLNGTEALQLWVPPGFAHGFLTLSEEAHVEYKCTGFYDPEDDLAIAWDDPELAIPWPTREPLLSERDQRAPRLRDVLGRLPRAVAGA